MTADATAEARDELTLEFDDIHFRYPNGVAAVGGITLGLPRRSIVSIVGPSGCGKSTLLRIAAGLETPTQGSVRWHRRDARRLPVTMIFQDDVILPWLTVRNNVLLSNSFRHGHVRNGFRHRLKPGSSTPEDATVQARADELLAMVGLSEVAGAHPAELSGGMRRRVAVLQALQPLPSVLLMDEPFAAVDEPTRIGIHGDVRALLARFGVSAMLVTHDVAEAITLGDTVVVVTNRPATVADVYQVPFGAERDLSRIRETEAFLALYADIWERLRNQIPSVAAATDRGGHAHAD